VRFILPHYLFATASLTFIAIVDVTGPLVLDQYRVLADFKKSNRNELNLVRGQIVDVVEKQPNGWWFVSIDDQQGYVPATYLEPLET
jgi:hypothetical protein